MPTTTFNPGQHGFHFSNNDIPWSYGPASGKTLCGGMVYTALDYYYKRLGIPWDTTPPALGSTLSDYIIDRQVTAHKNTAISFWLSWQSAFTTQADQIAKLRSNLGSGRPIPLCLTSSRNYMAVSHHVLAIACTDDDPPTISAYDPNGPTLTATFVPVGQIYSEDITQQLWDGFSVDDSYTSQVPPLLHGEDQWRQCTQCRGIFYSGFATQGTCPAGNGTGPHVMLGKTNYFLPLEAGSGEANWRWCSQCEVLFFAGPSDSGGVCPVGGGQHSAKGRSYNMAKGGGYGDPDWRWCNKCQGMFNVVFDLGVCPLNPNGHDGSTSPEYFIPRK